LYTDFAIRNFRGIRELSIEGLERLTLVSGRNDSGKTTLLEALFFHGGGDPQVTFALDQLRGIITGGLEMSGSGEAPWDNLFPDYDPGTEVLLTGRLRVAGEELTRTVRIRSVRPSGSVAEIGAIKTPVGVVEAGESVAGMAPGLQVEVTEDPGATRTVTLTVGPGTMTIHATAPAALRFRTLFQPARTGAGPQDLERFGQLEARGEAAGVLEMMRLADPRIQSLATLVVGGAPVMHAGIGSRRLIGLPLFGQGVTRLFALATNIAAAAGGVLLVDELENGLHYSALEAIWRAIKDGARRYDVQVVATTHSLDCIRAAHQAYARDEAFDFRFLRLDRENGHVAARLYDREALAAALESGLEMR
jgi:energy-coupling factor transporter ATP-binding protein EcfA2